jgi:hypothetical protein
MAKASSGCKAEGCKKPVDGGKGYCTRHYRAWRRGGLPKPRYKTCRAEGCRKPIAGRGRCAEHFARDYPGKQAASATAQEPAGGASA